MTKPRRTKAEEFADEFFTVAPKYRTKKLLVGLFAKSIKPITKKITIDQLAEALALCHLPESNLAMEDVWPSKSFGYVQKLFRKRARYIKRRLRI